MGHETPTLSVQTREKTGTRYAQRLRKAGRLPAVIYGKGQDPIHVSVEESAVLEVLHSGSHVLEISVDGKNNDQCLVKDLQFGWLGDNLIHLDLTRVDMNEIVTVNVPVNLMGNAKAASAAGAMLDVIRREIEVTCKVSDIPSEFKYDITDMEEAVTIGDLAIPEGVTPTLELEKHICHITFVASEEAEGEETEADGDDAQPEVITKPKEDGEGDSSEE
ncbi:MAG: 50S ribosomal protein L25 [Phycisphaerae bacterium]|nr:50S ribosomal protein L25 [Phycisphaerae bacterium]